MVDIADLLATYLGPQDDLGFADLTISRDTPGERNPANLAGGTQPTPATYTGRGTLERTGKFIDGTLVKDGHVLISILGGTISSAAIPEVGDRITFGAKTFKVTKVLSDQVNAMHECEAK